MRRPLPRPSALTQGFWDAAARHELVAQRCASCRSWRHYPQLLCPRCRSDEWAWERLAGTGTIHSFSVAHQAFHPDWAGRIPYAVATVELDEGIRMLSDMDEDPDEVVIGRRVSVFFEEAGDGITLPRFRLLLP
jgi:uncharacterized protein